MTLAASMVDIAFGLEGGAVPCEHRRALAVALEDALPWLTELPGAGAHPLKVSAGGAGQALLARRTRLMLRVPRGRARDAAALAGTDLQLGQDTLRVGAAQQRELRPYGTLYAHFVAADDADEAAFLRAVASELAALDAPCRPICGLHQVVEAGMLQGYSLMLDGLCAASSLRVQEAGLGRHRRLGCGHFVGHKSAAAVGVPA